MIVPCGVHSCQLVVEEDCYPVVDIDIDDTTEVAHIILQDGKSPFDNFLPMFISMYLVCMC